MLLETKMGLTLQMLDKILIQILMNISRALFYSSQGHDIRSVAAGPREQDASDGRAHHADGVEDPPNIDQTHGAPGVERIRHLAMDEASSVPASHEEKYHLYMTSELWQHLSEFRGVMIPDLDLDPESDFNSFWS